MQRFHLLIPWLMVPALLTSLPACKRGDAGEGTYDTAPVTSGDIQQHVTASGALSALVSVDVGSQVSGKISVLNVDYNSPVKQGDVVAEIDSAIYAAAVRQAKGELASAEASATLSRQNLERKRNLVPQRAATQADMEQAVAELAQAEAMVIIREASLQRAEVDLSYCRITAPVDGLVIARKVDLGQTLAAAMTTPVLFTIAKDITRMNINATVSEADIGQVKEGQSVEFEVDAFPDEVFEGTVTQVRKSPTTTANVVTYETLIAVDNPEGKLFPGMTTDVSILVAERKSVRKVPNAALRFVPSETTVFDPPPPARLDRRERLMYQINADGKSLKPIVVRTGITDNVDSELIDGPAEGTMVVTGFTPGGAPGGFTPPSRRR